MEGASIEDLVAIAHLGDVTESARRHVFVAPFPCRVASVRVVTSDSVPEDTEAYWEVALERVRDGARMVSKSTVPDTGEGITADTSWHFDVCHWDRTAAELASNDVVSLSFAGTGTSPPLRDVLVAVRYEPRWAIQTPSASEAEDGDR